MKQIILMLGLVVSLLLAARPAHAFRPVTYYSLAVPVYEFIDPRFNSYTLTNVDLIYKLSTPSATPVTWLLGYESLESATTSSYFRLLAGDSSQELGLRLEVDPGLVIAALSERGNRDYSSLKNKLLVGYTQTEREKLIDAAMAKFLSVFASYPKTVAAAYLDSYSLEYLQRRYSVQAALLLNDPGIKWLDVYHPGGSLLLPLQPYYPARSNALIPARTVEEKISLPVTLWNPTETGLGGEGLAKTKTEWPEYLKFWEQKSFNEYTFISLGSDNRLDPRLALSWYTDFFQAVKDYQEKFTLIPVKLSWFGDWLLARFPRTSPAYAFVAPDQSRLYYGNSHYRIVLEAVGKKTKVSAIEASRGESEPNWHQPLTTDSLDLPLYNLSRQEEIEFDLTAAKISHDRWGLILESGGTRLRFEPERIISSEKLTFVVAEAVSETVSDHYIYKFNPRRPAVVSPLTALGLLVLVLLAGYHFYDFKKAHHH